MWIVIYKFVILALEIGKKSERKMPTPTKSGQKGVTERGEITETYFFPVLCNFW